MTSHHPTGRDRLHLILSTDATVEEILRLGMGHSLQTMLRMYETAFTVDLYTSDRVDYTDRLGVEHHPLGGPVPLLKPMRRLLFYARLLGKAGRMDGIIRISSASLPIVPEIKRISNCPVIVEFHYDWASTARAHYGGIKRRLAVPFQDRCLRAADLVVATTRELRRTALTVYGTRAVVIPNFVDDDLFREGAGREERIVYAGRLHWAKGLAVLIDAFARIADAHPRLELVLLGGGEEGGGLRDRVPSPLRPRVRFLGSREQSEVADFLRSARISVLPTLTSEGNPKGVIEAMACGTPPVCSAVPGLVSLVEPERTGLLVPPGDAAALACSLERLLHDETLWREISRACLRKARTFGKRRVFRHQIRVMQLCAHGGESPRRGV